MFDMSERNKRLDDFAEWLETHELTTDDMLALLCASIINSEAAGLSTKLMVGGRIFNVNIGVEQ